MNGPVICGVAARSGGHIIPCLTLIQKERSPNTKVLFFSSNLSLDETIGEQFPWITQRISLHLGNVPFKKPWLFPFFIIQFAHSFFKSLYYLIKWHPTKIVSTGGYLSIPVCIAAKVLRIPVELFELNVIPGKASKVLAPLSRTLFTCFKETQKHFNRSCTLAPYPLRFTSNVVNPNHKQKALETLGYDPSKKTLLILGGSQGSTFLNVQLCNTLSAAPLNTFQVIHQTGHAHIQKLQDFYKQLDIPSHVFAYKQDLTPYYQAADIVICRAGAGTLFETAFFKKKCITIPLEIVSTSHQIDNAYAMQKAHPDYFTVLRQKELESDSSLLLISLLYPQT